MPRVVVKDGQGGETAWDMTEEQYEKHQADAPWDDMPAVAVVQEPDQAPAVEEAAKPSLLQRLVQTITGGA